ncbi:DUF2156 domain-containing protein [Microbulbifer epialgicus]|uniref:DUF2156 domain-containing protein n=1 Tax=Microbulbifer epialgicus TaxID=393907 RepID=A0ABV4P1J8_9GAMM
MIFSLPERVFYFKQFGHHSMSYTTLQSGLEYFDVPKLGYIAYKNKWGVNASIGDPICHKNDREQLLTAFLKSKANPIFVQVSESVALLLHELSNFYSTQIGYETYIDLNNWDLRGKKKVNIRNAINQANKQNILIEEREKVEEEKDVIRLSDEWLKTRKCKSREIQFLMSPLKADYGEGRRYFFAYDRGELIGLVFFDPIFENGRISGYVSNVSRSSVKFPKGIFYPIMIEAFKKFKAENVPFVSLNLSPFVFCKPRQSWESPILRKMLSILREYGKSIYNSEGIILTKSRFNGEKHPSYVVHKKLFPVREFIAMFKICNLM